jgi:putative SOS response-associated peptidase YedK
MHDRMPVIILERDYDRWLQADPERPPIDPAAAFRRRENDSLERSQLLDSTILALSWMEANESNSR